MPVSEKSFSNRSFCSYLRPAARAQLRAETTTVSVTMTAAPTQQVPYTAPHLRPELSRPCFPNLRARRGARGSTVGDQGPIEGSAERAPGGSRGSLGGENPGRFRGRGAASYSTAGRVSQTEGTACARLERGRGQSTFPGGRAPSATRGWGGRWAGARATDSPLQSMGVTLRTREAEGLPRRLKEL